MASEIENPAASRPARRESWSRYWSGGVLHSCSTSFEGNYAGEVREFWQRAAEGLAQHGRVLDIATGNGALPRLLLDLLPADSLAVIEAVDLADIRPSWWAGLDEAQRLRLRFHAGVPAERLPFADAGIDLVLSQFGLEYTDLPRALAEVRRVLRPGGRLALVVHARDSLIVGQAREELAHLDWLQGDSGPIDLAGALLAPAARTATAAGRAALGLDPQANALRERFNRAMAETSARARTSPCPDLLFETRDGIAAALAASARSGQASTGATLLAELAQLRADSELRLRELVDCALDRAGVEALASGIGAGVESLQELRFPNAERLGWGLLARAAG